MPVAITHVSPGGDIIIPANIKKKLIMTPEDRFLVFGEKDTLTLKKIEASKKSFDEVADPFMEKAGKSGLKDANVEEVIHKYRDEKTGNKSNY